MEIIKHNNRALVLVGGGGHCKSVIDAAISAGYTIKGIIEKQDYNYKEVLGFPIIGNDNDIPSFVDSYNFIITVGGIKSQNPRKHLYELILKSGGIFGTVIACDAYVSPFAKIGPGSVVLHGARINANAVIGENCIINTGAIIEHDTVIGKHSHISTSATVNGGITIGDEVFVGSQVTVNNGLSINSGIIVGSGAVVINDLKQTGCYVGNPAKLVSE